MQNVQDIFHTRKRLFISAFSISWIYLNKICIIRKYNISWYPDNFPRGKLPPVSVRVWVRVKVDFVAGWQFSSVAIALEPSIMCSLFFWILLSLYTNHLLKKYKNRVVKNMLPKRFWNNTKISLIKKNFVQNEKFGTATKARVVTKNLRSIISFLFEL